MYGSPAKLMDSIQLTSILVAGQMFTAARLTERRLIVLSAYATFIAFAMSSISENKA